MQDIIEMEQLGYCV